jgi:hypothetical protein
VSLFLLILYILGYGAVIQSVFLAHPLLFILSLVFFA